jgi:hypothetical protein
VNKPVHGNFYSHLKRQFLKCVEIRTDFTVNLINILIGISCLGLLDNITDGDAPSFHKQHSKALWEACMRIHLLLVDNTRNTQTSAKCQQKQKGVRMYITRPWILYDDRSGNLYMSLYCIVREAVN